MTKVYTKLKIIYLYYYSVLYLSLIINTLINNILQLIQLKQKYLFQYNFILFFFLIRL